MYEKAICFVKDFYVPAPISKAVDEHLISRRLTFLLNRVISVTNSIGQPFFRSHGLSIPEARVLIGLCELGTLKAGDLVELVSIDFSTMSHLLRRLEKAGLVERYRDEADGRAVQVKLTKQGERLGRACRQASLEHESVLIAGIKKSDVLQLKKLLNALYDNAVKGFISPEK